MSILEILLRYREGFAEGLVVTLQLSIITWTGGLTLGTILGVLGHRWKHLVGSVLSAFAFLLSATPFLVLLYWAHFPLQTLLDVIIDPFYTAVSLLTLLNTIGVAAICRIALDDFPSEYILAAKACGLSPYHTVRHIQLPLILRQVVPNLLNLQVTMLQMTLFASLISVEELFRVSQRINSAIHKPVEIYTGLAIFFLLICLPLNGIAVWLKVRFTRNISER
ncbi:MAG: ABC transporter permease subunit [Elusimicrobia bacterium]|nr:ABC transporter permease subunit [Elusimicrobiota bacterium]